MFYLRTHVTVSEEGDGQRRKGMDEAAHLQFHERKKLRQGWIPVCLCEVSVTGSLSCLPAGISVMCVCVWPVCIRVCVCVNDGCVSQPGLCVCTSACNERHHQPNSPPSFPQPHCILFMTTPWAAPPPLLHLTHTHTHTHRWQLYTVFPFNRSYIWKQSLFKRIRFGFSTDSIRVSLNPHEESVLRRPHLNNCWRLFAEMHNNDKLDFKNLSGYPRTVCCKTGRDRNRCGTEWRCGGVQLLLKEKCEQKSGTHISLWNLRYF